MTDLATTPAQSPAAAAAPVPQGPRAEAVLSKDTAQALAAIAREEAASRETVRGPLLTDRIVRRAQATVRARWAEAGRVPPQPGEDSDDWDQFTAEVLREARDHARAHAVAEPARREVSDYVREQVVQRYAQCSNDLERVALARELGINSIIALYNLASRLGATATSNNTGLAGRTEDVQAVSETERGDLIQRAFARARARWVERGDIERLTDPALEDVERFWGDIDTEMRELEQERRDRDDPSPEALQRSLAALGNDPFPGDVMQRACGRVCDQWASSHEGAMELENMTPESDARFWTQAEVVAAEMMVERARAGSAA